jgi:hypothetical protein
VISSSLHCIRYLILHLPSTSLILWILTTEGTK